MIKLVDLCGKFLNEEFRPGITRLSGITVSTTKNVNALGNDSFEYVIITEDNKAVSREILAFTAGINNTELSDNRIVQINELMKVIEEMIIR